MKRIDFPHIKPIPATLLILCLLINGASQAGQSIIEKGKTAPDFTLPDLKGEDYTLSRHIVGKHKATLLIIWGVWCPYCRAIMVMLKKEYPRLKAKGMEIITISIRESPKKIRLFINKLKPDFIVLTDEWGDLKDPYQIKDVPRIVILDKEGKVDTMAITTSAKIVETMIQNAMAEQ